MTAPSPSPTRVAIDENRVDGEARPRANEYYFRRWGGDRWRHVNISNGGGGGTGDCPPPPIEFHGEGRPDGGDAVESERFAARARNPKTIWLFHVSPEWAAR